MGLELPPAASFMEKLSERGVPVSGVALTIDQAEGEILDWLGSKEV